MNLKDIFIEHQIYKIYLNFRMEEYFVFGIFEQHFTSNAIFIPVSCINNEMDLHISKLLNIGPIITKNKNLLSKDELAAIQYFRNLLYILNHSYVMYDEDFDKEKYELLEKCMFYWINDDNAYLNIFDLRNKIISMNSFENKNIKITECFIINDRAVYDNDINNTDYRKKYTLHFFVNKTPTKLNYNYIDETIKKYMQSECTNVTTAKDNDGNCCNYGFINFINIESLKKYKNKTIVFENIIFTFAS
jgi:hypothetical protein